MTAFIPLLLGATVAAGAAPQPSVRRVAVIVGANKAAAGRARLRFSYDDARSMTSVLEQLGQFRPGDVVTLEDPDPEAVLAALDAKLAGLPASADETLLLFYYSGHADEQALYPNGKPLPYAELRRRLDGPSATVRIGIIDACSGGGWTQSKGLHPDEPFTVATPMTLSSEGSMLIASSSGVEKARESETIGGSFFTHHFVAGLRGAADQTGDGRVTVTEAFDYARDLTVRDSAISSDVPQHPSFAMNLHGRGEVALTYVEGSDSTVVLTQTEGPLQLIRLDSGLIVMEAPVGPRALRLAVAPGRYLVRRRTATGTFAREITVEAGKTTDVSEASLTLVGRQTVQSKRYTPADPSSSYVPSHALTLRVGVGVYSASNAFFSPGLAQGTTFSFPIGLYWHPTERLQVSILQPAVRYVLGDRQTVEVVLGAGLLDWYLGKNSEGGTMLNVPIGAQVSFRKWVNEHDALHLGLESSIDTGYSSQGLELPNTVNSELYVGYSHSSSGRWTVNVDLWVNRNLTSGGQLLSFENDTANAITLNVGSSRLLRFRLTDSLTADVGASAGWNFGARQFVEAVTTGISWGFL